MRFCVQRETILKPLQNLINIAERRQTVPILANVLLTLVNNTLILAATNIDIELIIQISVDESSTLSGDKLTVSTRKLLDMCRVIPENTVIEFYREGEYLFAKAGKAKFNFSILNAESFPTIRWEELNEPTKFSLAKNQALYLLNSVYFAMAQQDHRQYLNGVFFELKNGNLMVVASDSYRMALNRVTLISGQNSSANIVVPYKSIIELMRLLTDTEDLVEFLINNNYVRVKADDFIFTTKIIGEKYPNYERNIPKDNCYPLIAVTKDFRQAVERVAILANDVFNGIKCTINQRVLKMVTWNQEQEKGEEEISVEYDGPEIVTTLNVNYLRDILQNIKSEKLILNLKNNESGILAQEFESNRNNLYILMPLRL